jgi:hypothetical protein
VANAIRDKAKDKSQDEIIEMIYDYLKNEKMPVGDSPRFTRTNIAHLINDEDFLGDIISSVKSKTLNENSEKYMFFQNLETIKKEVEEMLSLDPQIVDSILANGHDWAADHISTSKDDIEEVHNFLMSNKAPMDEKKSFPDLTGDGKVTYADILKGRGVTKKK